MAAKHHLRSRTVVCNIDSTVVQSAFDGLRKYVNNIIYTRLHFTSFER